ncbi:hypothetical protein O2K51_01870 [Apibacter raozihei]|uniref:hypothetical protein n=1 Tax=Apibacter raozihei TaxID=2500547 RepID=UPI000FE43881|nr:hypothetical protein [Apibacter raozihei]
MKKEWREYHSEEGEIWKILSEAEVKEKSQDLVSKSGKPAVLRKVMKTTDYIVTCTIPAARIIDDVKNKIGMETYFHLKISLINDDNWYGISNRHFKKEEILELVNLFTGTTKLQAERIWKSKKLGMLNTNRLERE